jgi:hypothetical protein
MGEAQPSHHKRRAPLTTDEDIRDALQKLNPNEYEALEFAARVPNGGDMLPDWVVKKAARLGLIFRSSHKLRHPVYVYLYKEWLKTSRS